MGTEQIGGIAMRAEAWRTGARNTYGRGFRRLPWKADGYGLSGGRFPALIPVRDGAMIP
jgi:hypothetical protein